MTIVYLSVVATVGLLTALRVLVSIQHIRTRLLERVKGRRRFESSPTKGPSPDVKVVAQERAEASIRDQSTVTTSVVVPAILVVTLILMGIPFVDSVPGAILSVLVASVTVLAGIATRPILENAFAGVVVSASRLLNIGDTIEIGDIYGTIEDIGPTHTTVKVWDYRRFIIPNAQMLQTNLLNHSLHDRFVLARVEFWVSYDADLDVVRQTAMDIAAGSPHLYAGQDSPECWVTETAQTGVKLLVAAWAATPSEAWSLRHSIRLELVKRLQAMNVTTHLHRLSLAPGRSLPNG